MGQDEARVVAGMLGEGRIEPFGVGGRARLERQLARLGIPTTNGPGEADLLLSCDCLFGASVLAALAGAAPGTLLVDAQGRLAAARLGTAGPPADLDGRATAATNRQGWVEDSQGGESPLMPGSGASDAREPDHPEPGTGQISRAAAATGIAPGNTGRPGPLAPTHTDAPGGGATNDAGRACPAASGGETPSEPRPVSAGTAGGAEAAPLDTPKAWEDLAAAVAAGRQMPAGIGISGAALAGRYDPKLRKRVDPTVMRMTDRPQAERALFDASYKGVTDLVTKHVWPAPALVVTRWCAGLGITPNQVTWASAVLMALALWLFWEGWFGIGLVVAWAMTFLDTVDGKLARVTLTSSRFGDVLDHGIDLLHPPFWWWAWAVGCGATGQPVEAWVLLAIIGGYVLQRGEEGLFLARFGIEMHVWERFDSLFRQITARRNPNLLILTAAALAGAPREGLVAVALWTVLCLVIHAVRIAQAFAAARHGPLVPWLARA